MDDSFRDKLQSLLWDANTEKSLASENNGAVVARRWAVLATDLEKVLAYYIVNLEPKEESES